MEARAEFYVCGRIVITRGDRVLMGKETTTKDPSWYRWETPGGGLRLGETLEACLTREAREEIGVGVRVLQEIPRFRSFEAVGHHWLYVYCRCEPLAEPDLAHALDREFAELRFVAQGDFDSLARDGWIHPGEVRYLPEVMADLGLWAARQGP